MDYATKLRRREATWERCVLGDPKAIVQMIAREKFAFPGGYAIFGATKDGGLLCATCVRENYREIRTDQRMDISTGWNVLAWDSMANHDDDGTLTCDHCYEAL